VEQRLLHTAYRTYNTGRRNKLQHMLLCVSSCYGFPLLDEWSVWGEANSATTNRQQQSCQSCIQQHSTPAIIFHALLRLHNTNFKVTIFKMKQCKAHSRFVGQVRQGKLPQQ
jgi:hypothetical protein